MEISEIKRNLNCLLEKYKDKQVGVGQLRIDYMADDCLRAIAEMEGQIKKYEELAKAKSEGRLVVLPEGYEHAEELYHVVKLPKWCDEDGNGCEDCRHEVCNGDGASIDCTFKPYVSKIGANAVFDALYTLNGLSLSKESAEKALGGGEE